MTNTRFDISVIMVTYNPCWEKCVFTLDSIILQRGISIELVVVDDGSKDNLFTRITDYLDSKSFFNYKFVEHSLNQGTVKNVFDGLKEASADYVKLISPGDALYNETELSDWLVFLKSTGRKWSFGDVVYYSPENDRKQVVQIPEHPRLIDCYTKGDDSRCRWNYVVLEDFALGAALLCERLLLTEYVGRLVDKVKYTEDLSHFAMMYDGILPAYYNKKVVFYEYGTGVSTGKDTWQEKIRLDMKNAELLVAQTVSDDAFQQKLSKALIRINTGGELSKKIKKYTQKGGLTKFVKQKFSPRLSSLDCSDSGIWWND